jgi:D-ribose pyranase
MEQRVLEIIAGIGNFQKLIVCSADFSIPQGVQKLDLSTGLQSVAFLDVLKLISEELWIEEIIIAEGTKEQSPDRYQEMVNIFSEIKTRIVPDIEFKILSKTAKACIRTDESIPYSNIILIPGVSY